MNLSDFYFRLQSFLGRYPFLYYSLFARKYPFNQMKVRPQTDICIEGFPRSANSYAVVAFRVANPKIKIAHHLHVPAQLLKARQLHIPAVLLIRQPQEAVASFLVFQKSTNIDLYLKSYIRFHQAMQSIQSDLIIADFNLVIQNMNAIIQAVNEKFGAQFQFLRNQIEQENEIFTKLEQVNDQFFAGQKNKSMYPDKARQKAKDRALQFVQSSPLLPRAQAVFRQMKKKAI